MHFMAGMFQPFYCHCRLKVDQAEYGYVSYDNILWSTSICLEESERVRFFKLVFLSTVHVTQNIHQNIAVLLSVDVSISWKNAFESGYEAVIQWAYIFKKNYGVKTRCSTVPSIFVLAIILLQSYSIFSTLLGHPSNSLSQSAKAEQWFPGNWPAVILSAVHSSPCHKRTPVRVSKTSLQLCTLVQSGRHSYLLIWCSTQTR